MNEAYRHSALLLHSLPAHDRQWILAQLSADDQTRLRTQLSELREIGIPPDRTLFETALKRQSSPTGSPTWEGTGDTLRHAAGETMRQLLCPEPSWIIAAVLSLEAWPWREAVFVGLDASKRERVRQAIGQRPAPKLGQALIDELERRLPAASANGTAAPAVKARPSLRHLFGVGKKA